MDRKFLMTAMGYGILGLVLGIYMAASENHGQMVTHAHIMLLGFLVSFFYAVVHKLWLPETTGKMAKTQFLLHQLGTAGLVVGLYLLYGRYFPAATVGPVLGIFSITALTAFVLMKVMVIKAPKA
ncbi:MAG: TonB-dependent receptor [Woeseia sp.]